MNDDRPTHLDLFSGIGGFALAAQWAGFRTVGFCEINEWCRGILAKNWPGTKQVEDVATIDGGQFKGVDLLTGGFPCQPFSYSGERKGKEDDRYLWPEMLRVIQNAKPAFIIGENVDGLDGLGLDDCISDLEASGYEVAPPLEIPACAIGARHIRNRIWILANRASERLQRVRTECGGNEVKWNPNAGERSKIFERPSLLSDIPPGLQTYWFPKVEPVFLGGSHGISSWAHQAHALGNAIVPQVAFVLTRAIYQLLRA